jgi:hypothetical protein
MGGGVTDSTGVVCVIFFLTGPDRGLGVGMDEGIAEELWVVLLRSGVLPMIGGGVVGAASKLWGVLVLALPPPPPGTSSDDASLTVGGGVFAASASDPGFRAMTDF